MCSRVAQFCAVEIDSTLNIHEDEPFTSGGRGELLFSVQFGYHISAEENVSQIVVMNKYIAPQFVHSLANEAS